MGQTRRAHISSNDSLFRENPEQREGHCSQYWSVEKCDILRNKADLLQPTSAWCLNTVTGTSTVHNGQTIAMNISSTPKRVSDDLAGLDYTISALDRGRFKLKGQIVHICCAKVAGQLQEMETDKLIDLSPEQRMLVKQSLQLSPKCGTGKTLKDDNGIRAGDICTLIDGSTSQSDWLCVIIHRFCNTQTGSPSRRLLWIRNESDNPRSWNFYHQTVYDISSEEDSPLIDGEEKVDDPSSIGILDDGEKYVVYRVPLYADDFETTSDYTPNGSNGGCYMVSLNFPPCDRRRRSAMRVISVTPPGVSTNQVLRAIIPDLVKGSTEGVQGFLPSGEKVRISTDVLGFVGDYPASCHVIDSKTHTASAPCTLCNFRRYSGPETRAFKYGYTVQVNANDPFECRFGDRQEALRLDGVDDETARFLGMTPTSSVTDETCPLIGLQKELNICQDQVRKNSEGKRMVRAIFDAYRSNLVAPDHLLTGLAKNALSLLIKLTPPQMRSHIDIRICNELKRNGLLTQSSILKSNGKGLTSMSLSAVFCTLLVACPVFQSTGATRQTDGSIRCSAVAILTKLAALVAGTYWTPTREVDGAEAVLRREESDGKNYLAHLRSEAVEYICSVNELCTRSTIVARHLDKPNLHRLLELYTHTIPAFGHVNHFMELVFESAHQPLKRCITRGNHRNDHLSALEHCLGNDWQARLILLRSEMETSDQRRRQRALFGLKRLLLGRFHEESNMTDTELDQALQDVFMGPVEFILRSQCAPMTLRSQETSVWLVEASHQGVMEN